MEISDLQKTFIERLRRSKGDYRQFAYAFDTFLDKKSEKERIHPLWWECWDRVKEEAAQNLPEWMLERFQKAFTLADPIEPGIFHLELSSESRVTFLLGAGASAPAPSQIPTVQELLPELWKRAKRVGREELDKLGKWCEANGIVNIEDLLTAAYVANFAAKNSGVANLLDYFLAPKGEGEGGENAAGGESRGELDAASITLLQDTFQTLFGLLTSAMIPAKPNKAHESITDFLTLHPNAAIVTTNYDGCMDEAILNASLEVSSGPTLSESKAGVPDLIKMHGSINWTYCESCQEIKAFDLKRLKKSYEDDTLSFAVIGICRTCGGQRRPLLVPPLSLALMNFPNLVGLWNLARKNIEESEILIIAGYSFAEGTSYLAKVIARSLRANPKQRLIVVDSNAKLVPALRDRISAQIENFNKNRIIQAQGDCSELLPKIIEILINQSAEYGSTLATKTLAEHTAS